MQAEEVKDFAPHTMRSGAKKTIKQKLCEEEVEETEKNPQNEKLFKRKILLDVHIFSFLRLREKQKTVHFRIEDDYHYIYFFSCR